MAVTFTIIIPTYNSGKTLRRALDSILEQRYPNFEVEIIDGLSTDNTSAVIQEYATQDKRIHYSSEKDLGIYDAMNKGIHNASGNWLYFLGSDDRLHDSDVLTKVFAETKTGDHPILYGYIISEKNGRYGGPVNGDQLIKTNISHQAMFFNRKVFAELGDYDLQYKTHADWDFNLRCFKQYNGDIKYMDLAVADYAAGGASSVHELSFFRNVLIPERMNQLEKEKSSMYSIFWFDEWWRFIRNAKIKSVSDLNLSTDANKIPAPVQMMIRAQQKHPESTLTNGFSSKFLMSVTYFRYLFFRLLNKI